VEPALHLSGQLTNLPEDYDDSYTHRSREANGPSQQAPTAASYKQSLEREKQNRPSQGAREPQAIPERRHEREEEDQYRYPSIMSSSTESSIPSRDPSQYPLSNTSRSEEATYDHRSTAMMSKSSYNYSAPSKGFEHASRRHRDGTANIPAGGVSVNYRQTETTIEVNEPAYERTAPGNQYSSQPRYTERQIEEVKTDITLALKNRGLTRISLQEFDKLVNDRLKGLYGPEQQQYQSKPLSSNQGGQKPPTGPVPLTQFTEPGGQKPSPGFVPFTQFAGSGGQNPPPGSVPYSQIPGSEKPPEATQPDYTSSYGFTTKYVTSGGPESNYPKEYNESFFTEPPSQPYDSRSGKYKYRDGHNTKR
jgi:hypothetical protein